MDVIALGPLMSALFAEVANGAPGDGGAFILNSGDVGLLQSLEKIPAEDASRAVNDGATIAAHAQHVRYGLSLMNRWAREGGNPFADAKWDAAWKIGAVDAAEWREIRDGLHNEAQRWLETLTSRREATRLELTGMMSSIAHLAYHLGAIRQINKQARGPREGTFGN
jgi:hypothetical protein